jgi:hypothetical protein
LNNKASESLDDHIKREEQICEYEYKKPSKYKLYIDFLVGVVYEYD